MFMEEWGSLLYKKKYVHYGVSSCYIVFNIFYRLKLLVKLFDDIFGCL